ncbi:hypothetical protein RFI_31600 [Reticulomyxa filosa]|uniref:Viral A-type inclusion protein n=1 Tax=Reticulomyxa filosa TaxID=46433 RepID=X6LWQ9_RETFI|nr:hypothetical protein RFI_31600 [Reticulomyxa filosa]|eukprot:ETO05796.1 hypothetical protein RFI_31600 [Reticulomyxa filosa]
MTRKIFYYCKKFRRSLFTQKNEVFSVTFEQKEFCKIFKIILKKLYVLLLIKLFSQGKLVQLFMSIMKCVLLKMPAIHYPTTIRKNDRGVTSLIKNLKNEIDDNTKRMREKDTRLIELQQQLRELSEDKSEMQRNLKYLNEQAGSVTEIGSKLDSGFAKLNEDKIQLKHKVQEWKQKYETLEKGSKEDVQIEKLKYDDTHNKLNELTKIILCCCHVDFEVKKKYLKLQNRVTPKFVDKQNCFN